MLFFNIYALPHTCTFTVLSLHYTCVTVISNASICLFYWTCYCPSRGEVLCTRTITRSKFQAKYIPRSMFRRSIWRERISGSHIRIGRKERLNSTEKVKYSQLYIYTRALQFLKFLCIVYSCIRIKLVSIYISCIGIFPAIFVIYRVLKKYENNFSLCISCIHKFS